MKKNNLLLITSLALYLVACNSGHSTTSNNTGWTWVGGNNTTNSPSVYNGNNAIPGARDLSISWTDKTGNLWLFGGQGYAANNSESGVLNDLWKYNSVTKVWQLIGNQTSLNVNGVYGIQNQESSGNYPGGRFGSISWTDESSNLWLFGGFGYDSATNIKGALNDLWVFNTTTNKWKWVSGDKLINANGVYGRKGIPDSLNTPGARLGSVGFADESGHLWMFGGADSISTLNDYNDLWKFNTTTNQWTWVNGESTINSYGVYGIQQMPNVLNKPGARLDSVGWVDNTGNFWLFGGNGRDGIGFLIGDLNDLWRYNPNTNIWTWMSGSNMSNKYGMYGQLGVSSQNSIPGAREHRIPLAWVDTQGSFWMLAGDGYGANSKGLLNDLWQYNPTNNQWAWMGGSNESAAIGSYGMLGSSSGGYPGARRDSVGWVLPNGAIAIFGGYGYTENASGLLNDLWQFNPSN
ncbi:MAG: kelch repeat-containing protein [Burkholderiales bacterium]|nr:kelch repeat-containing protein [Burkholderiales bacterium]